MWCFAFLSSNDLTVSTYNLGILGSFSDVRHSNLNVEKEKKEKLLFILPYDIHVFGIWLTLVFFLIFHFLVCRF